jgi:hypothetical protein
MSTPLRNEQDGLTKREEMTVSGAAMSGAPLGVATVAGGAVAVADLALHGFGALHLAAVSGSVAAGVAVFMIVAAAGAVLRKRGGRAARWARTNPWKYAVMPGVLVGVIALVLTVVTGGGIVHGIFSGAWHGAAVFGITGAISAVGGGRKNKGV